jgi:hypothetical protein
MLPDTTIQIPLAWQEKRLYDRQYAAAAQVFDLLPAAWAYCNKDGVLKKSLLDASAEWSHGEQVLIKVALDLYDPGCVRGNGHETADIGEVVNVLTGAFYRCFIEAVNLAKGCRLS